MTLIVLIFKPLAPASAIDIGELCQELYEQEMEECADELRTAAIVAAGTSILSCLIFIFLFNFSGFLTCGLAIGTSAIVMQDLIDNYSNCAELAGIHFEQCLPCT